MLQVKLGDSGWKERYYSQKFDAHIEEAQEKNKKDGVSTMCWVV